MTEIGIRELKQNASAVVATAAAGEVITITLRGHPVAKLTKIGSSRLEELIASHRARPASGYITDLPAPPKTVNLSQELEAMRTTERY